MHDGVIARQLATYLGAIVIPITVHVPDHRVEDFYIRFGEFIADTSDHESPTRLDSGTVPSWVLTDEADVIAAQLWSVLSFQGKVLLHKLILNAGRRLTPDELAYAFGHPQGTSKVAGVLGGVGKAVRRADLPLYKTPSGNSWHYVWDWDGEHYLMTPEVASVLDRARMREDRS